jgi:Protein of unknown function (DUF3631)
MPSSNNLRRRIAALHAMLGSDNGGERENARIKILELLARNRMSWNDLQDLLQREPLTAASNSDDGADDDGGGEAPSAATFGPTTLVRHLLQRYVALKPHEYVAVTLWIVHTHVFNNFVVTPRLALTSPVRGCGKTTLLDIAEKLVARPPKSDSITAAAVYHLVDGERPTLLIDEADNLGLAHNGTLRQVFNSGHRRGGVATRFVGGRARSFSTFAPLAIAAIDSATRPLPLPIVHRSVVVHMERADATQVLSRFDPHDVVTTADFDIVYRAIFNWARSVTLNRNPDLPEDLRNRPADNWRPLISVADACGAEWGDIARAAAIEFAHGYHDEDVLVTLLHNIRGIFDARVVDRISSKALVAALVTMEDGLWSEWCGVNGDAQPRQLSQRELARLLSAFRIRPRSIRPLPLDRSNLGGTCKGYFRHQFEAAWRAYCSEDGTPAQPRPVRYLRGL